MLDALGKHHHAYTSAPYPRCWKWGVHRMVMHAERARQDPPRTRSVCRRHERCGTHPPTYLVLDLEHRLALLLPLPSGLRLLPTSEPPMSKPVVEGSAPQQANCFVALVHETHSPIADIYGILNHDANCMKVRPAFTPLSSELAYEKLQE